MAVMQQTITKVAPQGWFKKMDTATRNFIFLLVGATWAVILYGLAISFSNHTLVIDTPVLTTVLGIVGGIATSIMSARFGVAIHKSAQDSQQNQQPTP